MKNIREVLEQFLKNSREERKAALSEIRHQEMPELTEALFRLFEQNGNRLQYEEVYFARRKMLAILGLWGISRPEERERAGREPAEQGNTEQGNTERRNTEQGSAEQGNTEHGNTEHGNTEQGNTEQEYGARLAAVIRSVCEEECWALPAHVNRQQDPQWRVTVDLFAAETAQTLAELSDRLGDDLPGDIRELIRENVERRVFRPFFTAKVPYSGWERGDHNWNAVCCGAIGSACLHLLRGEPRRLEACLERICASLPFYIDGFAEDGTCMEGVGYYYYGMTYFVNFAQELYEYTRGEKDLFCGEMDQFAPNGTDKRRNIAEFPAKCFFRDGCSISFSDGNRAERFRMGVSSVLALHYGEPGNPASLQAFFPPPACAAGLHADSCYRFAALKLDWIYVRKLLEILGDGEAEPEISWQGAGRGEREEEAAEEKRGAWGQSRGRISLLPSAQWAAAQSASAAGFACKGGHNGEAHNHNDIGHFIYEGKGIFFLTDLGAGEYTREYFGRGRYEILCNNSFGHSLPIIQGRGQGTGKEYRCDRFLADQAGNVEMELHSAYPAGLLESFTRKFTFDLRTGSLTMTDCIRPGGSGITVLENLITQIPPVFSDGYILLEQNGVECWLDPFPGILGVTVKEMSHKNHQGQPEQVYALQWPVPISGDGFARAGFRAEIRKKPRVEIRKNLLHPRHSYAIIFTL